MRTEHTTFTVQVTVAYDADAQTHDEPEHAAQEAWLEAVPEQLGFGTCHHVVITEGGVDPSGVPIDRNGLTRG